MLPDCILAVKKLPGVRLFADESGNVSWVPCVQKQYRTDAVHARKEAERLHKPAVLSMQPCRLRALGGGVSCSCSLTVAQTRQRLHSWPSPIPPA